MTHTITLRRSRPTARIVVSTTADGATIPALTRDFTDLDAAQKTYDWINDRLNSGLWDNVAELASAVAAFNADGGAAVQPRAAAAPALTPCEVAA